MKTKSRKLTAEQAAKLRDAMKADPAMVRSSAVLQSWRKTMRAGYLPCVTDSTEGEYRRAVEGRA